jgi:hypothetical protein
MHVEYFPDTLFAILVTMDYGYNQLLQSCVFLHTIYRCHESCAINRTLLNT